jgi:hypothetical protein
MKDWRQRYPLNTFGYDTTTHQELIAMIESLIKEIFEQLPGKEDSVNLKDCFEIIRDLEVKYLK